MSIKHNSNVEYSENVVGEVSMKERERMLLEVMH